ncbi:alpha/beta fold hydrolase, partial [Romeria aff. gracilis LEGE 07310]
RYTYLAGPTTGEAPLLLLHGFGSSLEQWRENLVVLAQQRPVYALDLVGFGGSEKVAGRLGVDLWVEQVAAFWRGFLGQPMILLGHSLGALVALATAATQPEMVERLVMLTLPAARQELLSGPLAGFASRVEEWFSTPLLIRPLFALIRRPRLMRAILEKLHVSPERVDDALMTLFIRPTQERGAARTLCYLVKSRTEASFSPATRELVPLLQVPTLLLWGNCDRVIPIAWGQLVNSLNERLTLVEVDKAGHFLYDEQPDQIHQILRDWLGSRGVRAWE